MSLNPLGKFLIVAGAAIIVAGMALLFFDKIPLVGKLPGDMMIRNKNFAMYFPLGTSILISLLLTLILYIINPIRK